MFLKLLLDHTYKTPQLESKLVFLTRNTDNYKRAKRDKNLKRFKEKYKTLIFKIARVFDIPNIVCSKYFFFLFT